MKPPLFDYHAVTSVDEAVALLREQGDEAKILAGGQSLIPLLNLRLAHVACLVEINGLAELSHISEMSEATGLEFGAIVRHCDAAILEMDVGEVTRARFAFSGVALLRRAPSERKPLCEATPCARRCGLTQHKPPLGSCTLQATCI